MSVDLVAPSDVFELAVHEIRPQAPLPCGINLLTLCAIAATWRNTHKPIDPVIVRKVDGVWTLVDGRHRWLAAWVAGRATIRCKEDR